MKTNSSITLKATPERQELVKAMIHPDRNVAMAAQAAFARYITPAVELVLNQKATYTSIYRDLPFSQNERPTIPLDMYLGATANHIQIWSQTVAGGLASSLVQGNGEYTFQVFRLDSAVHLANEYVRNANLPVITKAVDRMINEILVKLNINAWTPLLTSLGAQASQVLNSTISGVFQLQDLNKMFVALDRQYVSYSGGTPDGGPQAGLTDLFVSPEIVAQIRGFAYNPMNTRGGYKSDGTEMTGTSVALPESMRENIFKNGGMMNIFGVDIHKLIEFGVNRQYNTIFDNGYAGTFNTATQEILFGLNLTHDVFLSPVISDDSEPVGAGASYAGVVVKPDDQFYARSDKTGWFAFRKQGFILLDSKPLIGLIV